MTPLIGRKRNGRMAAALSLLACWVFLLCSPDTAAAHHGVASLGAAGLEGPGAPIETSSSATLPRGEALVYLKVDYAPFKKRTAVRDAETDHYTFWLFGLGYGFTPYLSGYVFLPVNTKVREDNSFNTSGLADASLIWVVGFKYDEGFRLVPASESLDDLEDWHFTVYGGVSLPTGDENTRDRNGDIDPGFSLGFGEPSLSAGATATKTVGSRATLVGETSYISFFDHRYADGNRTRFGSEFRLNTALSYRVLTLAAAKLRLDANLEANYLRLDRDRTNGVAETATGGDILYAVPGFRLYWKQTSVGLGVKLPVATDLNEERLQQGAEGKEKYRLLVTLSMLI